MKDVVIFVIGDIAGKPGMQATRRLMNRVLTEHEVDFVIANGENSAGGVGITPDLANDIFRLGAHCITTGNHVWRHREIREYIEREPRLLRPHNYLKSQPGSGQGTFETPGGIKINVINLVGRVYMDPAENPFVAADAALGTLDQSTITIVDFHAEATSEKRAMGFYLDGRVTAVVGTHTHVQTADEQILPGNTAYITDIGMTGPHDSIIGMRKDLVIDRFVTGLPHPFRPAKGGARLQGVLIRADRTTFQATSISRIDIPLL